MRTLLLLTLISISVQATTYRTINDGNWSDSSIWKDGSIPLYDITNDTIFINNDVVSDQAITLRNNSLMSITGNLIVSSGDIVLHSESSFIRLYGSITVVDGNFHNKEGNFLINDGTLNIKTGDFKNESIGSNGVIGNGNIIAEKGNIINGGALNFSTDISWCSVEGNGTDMPTIEDCSILSADYLEIEGFSLYPIPTEDMIYINVPREVTQLHVFIYDMLSREVYNRIFTVHNGKIVMATMSISTGQYIVKVHDTENDRVSVRKILIK